MKVTDVEVRWSCKRCRARGLVWGRTMRQAKRRLALEKANHRGREHG